MPADPPSRQGSLSAAAAAREALILGHPPRIAPLHPDSWGEDVREIVSTIRGALSLPPDGEIAEYHATLLRHPQLYRRHSELAVQLFRGALTPRQREFAILRTGWLCQAPYEWGEHVAIAKNIANLTSEEIERVTWGSAAPGWNDDDRAIIRAVEELHEGAMISDETWKDLTQFLDERQLLELPILVGQYQGLANLLNTLRARLKPANPGFSAR